MPVLTGGGPLLHDRFVSLSALSGDRQGYFGPRSISWKVNREAALLLGGGRALLMQIAHPLVAAGVADHSDFRRDPFGRLRRTLEMIYAVTFGTRTEADKAWRGVDAVHGRVRGALAESAGRFARGSAYRARDPHLLLWVHATLVETSMVIYQRYVARLSRGEWKRYYQESKVSARLFGIPEAILPPDLEAFEDYVHRMVRGDELAVTETARDLAQAILHPPVPYLPSALFEPLNLVTVGLLPAELRRRFGLEWGPTRQLLLDASSAGIRTLVPLLPDLLRSTPAARAAERRVARAA